MTLPLEGVRVLELGRVVAAPLAAQMLADLGAEVIKVEQPVTGDYVRSMGAAFVTEPGGERVASALFTAFNRSKKSVTIDYSSSAGQVELLDLARRSDVVFENFTPGTLARYGLDYASLSRVNGDLIYCSITAYGQSGPMLHQPGTDPAIQALSGMMSVTGEPDGPAERTGFFVSDVLGAKEAAYAVLASLYARAAGQGGGRHIDIALLDVAFAAMANRVQTYLLSGVVPARMGQAAADAPLTEVVPCADGPLLVNASRFDKFEAMCRVIGHPELSQDARFIAPKDRARNRSELRAVCYAVFRRRKLSDWQAELERAGIVCAPVLDIAQALALPQVVSRQLITEVVHAGVGPVPIVANPVRADGFEYRYTAPPRLGAHNREVLGRD